MPDKLCVFPFKYYGVTYNGCTSIDYSEPWCSVATDDNGNYVFNTNCEDGDSGEAEVNSGNIDIELTTDLSPTLGKVQQSMGHKMSRIQEFIHTLLQFLVKKR